MAAAERAPPERRPSEPTTSFGGRSVIVSRSIEPKAPAYRAAVSGVIEVPTMPRAPEMESMKIGRAHV